MRKTGLKIGVLLFFVYSNIMSVAQQFISPLDCNGLIAWWCADSVKQDNETIVDLWRNLINYEMSVSQSTSDYSPKLKKNISELNAHAVLHFDGNDFFSGGNILNIGQKGQTVFIVAKPENARGTFYAKTRNTSSNCRNAFYYTNSKPRYQIQTTSSETTLYFDGEILSGNYELFSAGLNVLSGELFLFQENVSIKRNEVTLVKNFTSSNEFLIGAYNDNNGTVPPVGTLYLEGDIAEIIFYDHLLANIERQSVENYLRSKYFPGTEREQFSFGDDVNQSYSLKPVVLTVPDRDYFKTYKWNTGETTQSINVQTSGMYDVFVTDDWGYEYVDTISISFPELKYIQSQTICDGESLVWDCGLSGDYSYAWSTGETTQAISITKAGKYAVTVTDNEGYSIVSDTVVIEVDDFSTTAKLGADTALCAGNCIGLVSRLQDARSYAWNTGETTATIAVENSGTYSLAVTNERGCTATDEITVAVTGVAPIVKSVFDNHCFGDQTELLSNSYTTDNTMIVKTTWFVEDDTLTGSAQTHQFSNIGSFPVKLVVDNEAGCSQFVIDTITIHPVPVADFSPVISCQFTANDIVSTTKIASGSIASYEWSGIGATSADSLFVFRSDTVGSYPLSLTVTSDFGCSNSITADVVVRASSKIEFIHSKACIGDTVLFFDISEYQPYNPVLEAYWQFGDKKLRYTDVLAIRATDTLRHPISLHVKTFNGCVNIAYDTLRARDVPHPLVLDTVFSCPNTNVLLHDGGKSADEVVDYVWNVNGEIFTDPQPIVDFAASGVYHYTLSVQTAYECANHTQGTIAIDETPQADFTFYPEYGAAPLDVDFTNTSEHAVSYEWTFEQSVTTNDEHPSYTFDDKTNSYAKLRAISQHGCADSVIKFIPVQLSDLKLQILDVVATLNKGQIQYTIQILNTGNDNIPEMEISLQSPDFPMLTETWFGALKANGVLNYTFTTKTAAKNGEIPAFLCASASIASANQNATYYRDEFCKDNSGEFMVYSIAPNPVEKTAKISFNTKQKGTVTIECYDDAGKVRLSQEFTDVTAGFHTIQFDASQLPTGRYTVQIAQGNQKERMAIMKR